MNQPRQHHCPVTRISQGPGYHLFGYYDKCPWSPDGRWIALQRTTFMDRNPGPQDTLAVGVCPANGGAFQHLAQTFAWNWQQASMLRWLPGEPATLMFNDRDHHHFLTRACDTDTGDLRTLCERPIYDITEDGRLAASLNFARVGECRPGYGYCGGHDDFATDAQPADDGLFLIDLTTGKSRLACSLRDAADVGRVQPAPTDKVWFNHPKFSPSGKHLFFLHRWAGEACPGHHGFATRVLILETDSGRVHCLSEGRRASHYDWFDDDHLLIFLYHEAGDGYYLIDVRNGDLKPIAAGLLGLDGHCVYRPQRDWFATDTYPAGPRHEQPLLLYHPSRNDLVEIGRFAAQPVTDPSLRCDLHAAWDRQGTQLCFDSTHQGDRQVYTIDVSALVESD